MTEGKWSGVEEKSRRKYLDLAKGVGILMVTYVHVARLNNPVNDFMNLFKITVFFVIAGWLLSLRRVQTETGIKEFAVKKFKTLMIPYFGFSVISIIIRIIAAILQGKKWETLLVNLLGSTIILRGFSVFWFLPVMFLAEVLFYSVLKSNKKIIHYVIWLCPALFIVGEKAWKTLVFNPGGSIVLQSIFLVLFKCLIAVWFVNAGYMLCEKARKINSDSTYLWWGLSCLALTAFISCFQKNVNFNAMKLGTEPALFFIGGLVGSLGTIFLFKYSESWAELPLVNYFGKNSLSLLCTQGCFLLIGLATNAWAGTFKLHKTVSPVYFFETFFILLLLLLMAYGLNELIIKYFPWLLGKNNTKKIIEN